MSNTEESHQSAFQYGRKLPSIISAARLLRLRSESFDEEAKDEKKPNRISPFSPEARVPLPCEIDENYGTTVWKRNERERLRVRCVNDGYERLRDHLPLTERLFKPNLRNVLSVFAESIVGSVLLKSFWFVDLLQRIEVVRTFDMYVFFVRGWLLNMSKGGGQKLSKEDELLLKDFSAAVSTKGSALFYGNSTVIAIAPLYLFHGIHQMEIADSWIIWLISWLTASYLISFAYKNIKHILKHKIVVKRSEAITREMSRKLADDKKMSKKEKDERILWKKNEVGDYEATTFSIFWNNVLFLSLLLVLSFFLFASLSSTFNCLFSMVGAAGLVALFSTAK
ncbi:unnamed protein product [Litomosoides sigmodontis]|uniref:Translocon-associated protein subunit gamma n=1 Tax=Litomosoides sigmodontis TaxID=42156 RepID=A0A3P6TMB3_LITSI|nr:unnamed protein product [Litomosoides sigmodontis]